ncbi:MAG: diaminopimelate epimerase [Firmicutes bacterium]|nr:diaminopimelate epimerase [Bacillota bacterium]
MRFTKMHGAGNDFIIINNMDEGLSVEEMKLLAKKLCQRRLSIGADGMMAVEKPDCDGDYKMVFFNADGSIGEMCGNGARCIARYGYEKGLAGETQRIETTAGMVVGRRLDERTYRIRLNDVTKIESGRSAVVKGEKYPLTYVEMGNPGLPHIVVGIDDLQTRDRGFLSDLGQALRYDNQFEKGTNVNFYQVVGEDELVELTYERGVEDFTMACGTGTGCVVYALTKEKKVSGQNVKVHVPGGLLTIDLCHDEGGQVSHIFLTGPTNIVAEGDVLDEDL